MYIADSYNSRIRRINTSGIITTVAGSAASGYSGDGGLATAAELNVPYGVCINNTTGEIYIGDTQNNRVRALSTSGIITTLAGNGVSSYSGDGGPATASEVNFPAGVSLDYQDNLYVDDYDNHRIRKITFEDATGTTEITTKNEISIFPNPSKGTFTLIVEGPQASVKNIEIYNVLGSLVMSEKLNGNNNLIDLGIQASGIYLYRVLSNDGFVMGQGKLIIQK
jgi:hypothetical protein